MRAAHDVCMLEFALASLHDALAPLGSVSLSFSASLGEGAVPATTALPGACCSDCGELGSSGVTLMLLHPGTKKIWPPRFLEPVRGCRRETKDPCAAGYWHTTSTRKHGVLLLDAGHAHPGPDTSCFVANWFFVFSLSSAKFREPGTLVKDICYELDFSTQTGVFTGVPFLERRLEAGFLASQPRFEFVYGGKDALGQTEL
jgi:hypothetical protein